MRDGTSSRLRGSLVRLLVYAAAGLVFTWPLALHPFDRLGSIQGPGDSYLNLWTLGWDLHTLTAHPAALFTGRIFDANIFYPATRTLAFSDHLLLQAIALAPIYLVTRNLVFCYNVLLVASLVACGWSMDAFARRAIGSPSAAWVAGIAWGFAPYHFGHLIHLQLQALYFLPLTFLFLLRLAEDGRRRDAVLLGVVAGAQAVGSVYYGVIGVVGLACGLVALWAGGRRRPAVGRLLLAG